MTQCRATFALPMEVSASGSGVYKMRSFQQKLATFTDNAANLVIQFWELKQLRERLKRAQQSGRKSPQIDRRKRTRIRRLEHRRRLRRRQIDPKIVDPFSRLKLCGQPAGLHPAACPSLGRLRGIPIFRIHLRVRAPRMTHLVRHSTQAELAQSLIKPCFFGCYSASQCRGDKFVKGPKLVRRHRFEIIRFHF